MASTSFVDLVTLTAAAWFNDVDITTYSYLTSVSGTNTITATGPVPLGAYAAGNAVRFIPANTNTGATTINITPSGGSALGARNIFANGAACVGGEIKSGVPCLLIDDGTRYNIIGSLRRSAWDVVTRATVDQSITSDTTLASATNMSFSIAASEEWVADFYLDIGAGLSTTGWKFAVTVPASATLNAICALVVDAFDDTAQPTRWVQRTTTGGAAMETTPTNLPSTAGGLMHISVWVLNSTNAGTVQLQVAQSTSSATALTIRKGSHMVAHRVA